MLSRPMTSHKYQLTRTIHVLSNNFIKLFTYANIYPGNTSTTMSGIRCRLLIRILKMRWRCWHWRTSLCCGISWLVRFLLLGRKSQRPTHSFVFSTAHILQFIICSFLGRELPKISVCRKAHSHNKATPTPNPLEKLHEQAMLAKYGKK